VLRAIDKLDRLGPEGVQSLLGKGRKDESGDFTKGAGLAEDQIKFVHAASLQRPPPQGYEFVDIASSRPLDDMRRIGPVDRDEAQRDRFIDNFGSITYWRNLHHQWGARFGGASDEGFDELKEMVEVCEAAGFGSLRVVIDPSVVRGLEYYTGPVFEAELTVPGEDGKPVRFGSVGGGGRYDGLVGRFRGENVPATGFSIGVSRLFAALKAINSPIVAQTKTLGPVVVLVLDKDHLARYQNFVTKLRAENISAELYLGQSGMNAQLKYADKRGSVCAVIQGSNERSHRDGPQVTIRDLVLGAELAASTKDRADYLELRANAQFSVPEDRLVESVQEVLARHG
ncbi:MAG: ATP phosphoribosyltransferase regulatory subunit, partial [Methylocella sp.]